MVLGGIFGTIAGALVLLVWHMRQGAAIGDGWDGILFMSAVMGGTMGVVLGPLAAWTLLRRVPLWLAVIGPTFGTVVSGGLAVLVTNHPLIAILVGMIGTMGSAAALYDRFLPDPRRLTDG